MLFSALGAVVSVSPGEGARRGRTFWRLEKFQSQANEQGHTRWVYKPDPGMVRCRAYTVTRVVGLSKLVAYLFIPRLLLGFLLFFRPRIAGEITGALENWDAKGRYSATVGKRSP